MIYEVYDKPANVSYEKLDAIIYHACKELDIANEIMIEFDNLGGVAGNCDVEEDIIELTINNTSLVKGNELALTIFHELVHAKQILDGRLVQGEGLTPSSWCGIIYTCEYKKLPWEVEAYYMEKQLLESFHGSYEVPR